MFDIDTGKLLIVAVLALIVIGPKDLPRVMRQVGQAVGRLRRMASEFQGQFMDAIKDAEIEDIRKELNELKETAKLDVPFDPARDIQAELTGVMTAKPAVAAETTAVSPTANFVLPSVPEEALSSESAFASGVAPVVAEAEALEAVHPMPGTDDVPTERTKRKILLKPRRSTFGLVNNDPVAQAAGQALVHRRGIVRPRRTVVQDAASP